MSPLKSYLKVIDEVMRGVGVTEVMINRPGELIIEDGDGKQFIETEMDGKWLSQFAKLVAGQVGQTIDPRTPLLSANLPDGERIQIVMPPAVEQGQFSISIRKPIPVLRSLSDYTADGAFALKPMERKGHHGELLQLIKAGQIEEFMKLAIKARLNILIAGGTGSGKTTFCNALIREIPAGERIITIEDVREIRLEHRDCVHLLYSKGDQGESNVTPQSLLQACLRLNPTRLFVSELRGAEAYEFLRAANSGHPGSISTLHANSATEAFDQLVLMVQLCGFQLTEPEIRRFLEKTVDVVLHFEFNEVTRSRYVTGLYYRGEIY